MSASSPVPKDHPLMVAWEAYKQTDDFKTTKVWAQHPAHVDGSLWAVFERGWLAAGGRRPFDDRPVCENCQQPIDGSPVITADEVYLHEECARGIWPALTVVQPPAASGPPASVVTDWRCGGCDHRWPERYGRGAMLCGDCWRKVQPVLHASGPPAAPPGTVEQCAWLVETHILSHLHYLRSWNARRSKPEWTSRNDEAWRFARREDADKALVYLAGGDGRVAEHLWMPVRPAPPVVVPEAPAPPRAWPGYAPSAVGDLSKCLSCGEFREHGHVCR